MKIINQPVNNDKKCMCGHLQSDHENQEGACLCSILTIKKNYKSYDDCKCEKFQEYIYKLKSKSRMH